MNPNSRDPDSDDGVYERILIWACIAVWTIIALLALFGEMD